MPAAVFEIVSKYPPSITSDAQYFCAVSGMMLFQLIAVSWWIERHRSLAKDWAKTTWASPARLNAVQMIAILWAMILASGPDVVLLMAWPDLTATGRASISNIDRWLDGFTVLPLAIAFVIERIAGPSMSWQLHRMPSPVHLWPKREELVNLGQVTAYVVSLAFVLTYLRGANLG